MAELDLLTKLPKSKRNIGARAAHKTADAVARSRQFGYDYFDGSRDYGYGGYRYDGRWVPVAHDIADHYGLEPGMAVLDVGCAKGFLVKDLGDAVPGLDVYGLDISRYALTHCVPDASGRLVLGTCERLPFPDGRFDLVVSLDTVHNLPRDGVIRSLREFERVGKGAAYIRVDSYHTDEQRKVFVDWVLTARFHDFPAGWEAVFEEAGYTGDWTWTIID